MKRMSLVVAFLLVAACVVYSTAQASSPPPHPSKIDLHAFEHGLRPSVLQAGEAMPHWSIAERMAHYHVPGVAIAILRHGEVIFAAGYGVRDTQTKKSVNANTLFSVGSVSKVVTAAITLRRAAQGKVSLDHNVENYLSSWHIPKNPDFPHAVVTLRMLMSHTSGLNVHGFMDFPPGKPFPTLLQTLNGTAPAMNGPVHLIYKPGTRFHYSGGGVEVEQQVIEDSAGASLENVARVEVFKPLDMTRSTFADPLPATTPNVAHAYNAAGKPVALPRGWQSFAGLAASGLWASADDLGKLVGTLLKSYQGRSDFLPEPITRAMMTKVSPSPFGLGVALVGEGTTRYFYKAGANNDYRAWIEGHLETGDGLVILTNGADGSALISEIRNAVGDMLGWHVDRPVIRAIRLSHTERQHLKKFAGSYQADDNVPMALQQWFADLPFDALEIRTESGHIFLARPGRKKDLTELVPLGPMRFVAINNPTLQVVFHRDAAGRVSFTLETGESRAYYTRKNARNN